MQNFKEEKMREFEERFPDVIYSSQTFRGYMTLAREEDKATNRLSAFISQTIDEAKADERKRVLDSLPKEKIYDASKTEYHRLFIDPVAIDGYNKALEDIKEILR